MATNYASPSTVACLEQELAAVGDKFQDAHDAINALLVMDLLPGDLTAMETDLQTLVGLKRTLGNRRGRPPRNLHLLLQLHLPLLLLLHPPSGFKPP